MPETELDLDKRYIVDNYRGIAWYLLGYEIVRDEDYEWTGMEYENKERVRAVMVGDDRVFVFGVDELIEIDEEDFCPECGQIGCKAGRL